MLLREIRFTADGSTTIYLPELKEGYHSSHGAIQESLHVFISNGLLKIQKPSLTILELGFGTGLNAWLTLIKSKDLMINIRYISIEKYPLRLDEIKLLNYPSLLKKSSNDFIQLHEVDWQKEFLISEHFSMTKICADFQDFDYSSLPTIDVVYFDCFGFRVQPELWTGEYIKKIYHHMAEGGLLTTYASKGIFRRYLEEIGFKVEKIAGPKGKREMINAWKK